MKNNGYVTDIKKAAKENKNFRDVIFTGPKSQLVLMSLLPDEEIGLEVHDGDQIIYVVDGEGVAILDGTKNEIEKGSIAFVPAGVAHNIINTDHEAMKLFTIYAPSQHAAGTIQATKGKKEAELRPKDEEWPEEAAPDADSEPALNA